MPIKLKSAYEAYHPADGHRYLVETYWPEGLEIFHLQPCEWLKEIAPSYELRTQAELEDWGEKRFREEYVKFLETSAPEGPIKRILEQSSRGTVTLLCDTHKKFGRIGWEDTTAYDLREFLKALGGRPVYASRAA